MKFSRPVGAVRDVRELEYMVALHQSSHDDVASFLNGSIDAADVKAFLMSRHGIDVSKEEVRRVIFSGLAGGDGEDICLDLVEVVSILIIPLLVKANDVLTGRAEDWSEQDEERRMLQPPPTIIADVLETILHDTLGAQWKDGGTDRLKSLGEKVKRLSKVKHSADGAEEEEFARAIEDAGRPGETHMTKSAREFDAFHSFLQDDIQPTPVEGGVPQSKENTAEEAVPVVDDGTEDGDEAADPGDDDPSPGAGGPRFPRLTPEILRAILAEHDEVDTLDDEGLMRQMILVAKGEDSGDGEDGTPVLDVAAFARALTSDIDLYDVDNETKYSTILRDVLGERGECPDVRTKRTLSQIDFVSDNVRSWQNTVLMWMIVLFSYIYYVWSHKGDSYKVCTETTFGCKVLQAIWQWVYIMLELTILGGVVGVGLSCGNGGMETGVVGPLLGIAAAGLFVFFPYFYHWDTIFFTTQPGGPYSNSQWIILVFGILIVLSHVKSLVGRLVDTDSVSKRMRAFFLGSNGRAEFRTKQAGIYKVNQMVKNAYELHKSEGKFLDQREKNRELKESHTLRKDVEKSTKEVALQNYADAMDEKEEWGGLVWVYKSFLSGALHQTEGIWLSSRLMAAVAIMLVSVFLLFGYSVWAFNNVIHGLYDKPINETCYSYFDYDKCFFPWGGDFYTGTGVCTSVQLVGEGCFDSFGPIQTELGDTACSTVNEAIEGWTELVLGNLTCSDLSGFVEQQWIQRTGVPIKYFGYCRSKLSAGEEFEPVTVDSNGTEYVVDAAFCQNITSSIEKAIESFEDSYDTSQPTMLPTSNSDGMMGVGNTTDGGDPGTGGASPASVPVQNPELASLAEDTGVPASSPVLANSTANETESLSPYFLINALNHCMDLYGTINSTQQTICNRALVRPLTSIATFEKQSVETQYCMSYLSICSINPFDDSTAACVIGEKDLLPFEFSGPSCENYPEIKNLQDYQKEKFDFFPQQWAVQLTAGIAIVVGFMISLATTLVYIPSSITTLMKFRSGVIPSLRDPTFLKYREGLQNMAYLIGAMFWGLVINTVFMVIITAGVVFLVVWQVTRPYLVDILAQIVGISVTVVLKMGICWAFMRMTHSGYYRRRPASANAFGFALECWYLGLTTAFAIARFIKFCLTTALYVGRIDRPVLAEGLVLDMDSLPKVFRQNLLATDAHRHPYIELLGLIYLMKLRHKEDFATAPGAAWRALFVDALMPWLKKMRIEDVFSEDGDNVGKANIGFFGEMFAGVLAIQD